MQRNEYDGMGRRIRVFSEFDGSTPSKVVDDYQNGRQTIESEATVDSSRDGGYQTIWSPRYIDAPILRDTLNTAGTGIVATERVFYLADANYNVTSLVKYDPGDERWEVAERYTYTPYGGVTYRNADWTTASASANANTTLYTGRTLDVLSSLYYYRARYYDATLERFVSRDPIVYKGGMDLYEYVGDSPLTRVDPKGLEPGGGSISKEEKEYAADKCGRVLCALAHNNLLPAIEHCYSRWLAGRLSQLDSKMGEIYQAGNNFATKTLSELGADNTLRNHSALRHCYASGNYAALLGCAVAGCLGHYREEYQMSQGQSLETTRRQDYNNGVGRECAGCEGVGRTQPPDRRKNPRGWSTPEQIGKCCKEKFQKGELYLSADPPETIPPKYIEYPEPFHPPLKS